MPLIQYIALVGCTLAIFLGLVLARRRPFDECERWLGFWLSAQILILGTLALPNDLRSLEGRVVGNFALFMLGPAQYLYAAATIGAPRLYRRHMLFLGVAATQIGALFAFGLRIEDGLLCINAPRIAAVGVPLLGLALAMVYPVSVLTLLSRRHEDISRTTNDGRLAARSWLRTWAISQFIVLVAMALAAILAFATGESGLTYTIIALCLHVANIVFVGVVGLSGASIFSAPIVRDVAAPRPSPPVDQVAAQADFQAVLCELERHQAKADVDLTSPALAGNLGWPQERLSAALRVGGETNFYGALNLVRLRVAKALLKDPRNARLSLLHIAHDAGFGSKTAFYDAFARHFGCSPGEWRKRSRGTKTP